MAPGSFPHIGMLCEAAVVETQGCFFGFWGRGFGVRWFGAAGSAGPLPGASVDGPEERVVAIKMCGVHYIRGSLLGSS